MQRRSAALSSYTFRSRSFSIESSEISEGFAAPARRPTRRSKRTRPVVTPDEESSEDDTDFYELKPSGSSAAANSTKAAMRPQLETVDSSESSDVPKRSQNNKVSASMTAETLVEIPTTSKVAVAGPA